MSCDLFDQLPSASAKRPLYRLDGTPTEELKRLMWRAALTRKQYAGWRRWVVRLSEAVILPAHVAAMAKEAPDNATKKGTGKFVDPDLDMMVFDNLPRCVRDALNEVPVKLDAASVIQQATAKGIAPAAAARALYSPAADLARTQ